MSYDEARDAIVTKRAALYELRKHGVDDPSEFFADCGEQDYYVGATVLDWLGY